jgi:oligoribonuclease NrnB/cAMP/cGMP phosphodiesterase (DHH superfamily)
MLDHHKTAIEQYAVNIEVMPENVTIVFDLKRSGAGITWDYFYPDKPRPDLINYVEDRDLWLFKFGDYSRAYTRALGVLPNTPSEWANVRDCDTDDLVTKGFVLLRSDEVQIEWHLNNTVRFTTFCGYTVPIVNVPKYLVSETLSRLTDDHPFVIGYHDTAEHRVMRLNSNNKNGVDVAVLAEKFGGGGHAQAAGILLPRTHLLAML